MEKELEQQENPCLKIVLYGPESTGKTSLAQRLAEHFQTTWVSEFARDYLQLKWQREQKICELDDILPIAEGQMQLENQLAGKAREVLFCDTNLLETAVYSRAYFDGFCDERLLKDALNAHYDLYFLMYIDVPWVPDDLRDRPGQREEMFQNFKQPLDKYKKPYVILKGNHEERFATAVKIIQNLIKIKKLDFSSKDLSQIEQKGLTKEEVTRQIAVFERGNIAMNILEAATHKNGIKVFEEEEKEQLKSYYASKKDQLDLLKFVPASGAATRMFKAFYRFLQDYEPEKESLEDYLDRKGKEKLEVFFRNLKELPFYEQVVQKLEENPATKNASDDEKKYLFVKMMLGEEGLDLGNHPKGLVPFHKYDNHLATAFEEHFIEAADYAAANNTARLHFTVAKEHLSSFEQEYQRILPRLESETGVKFEVSYSFQDPKTDTIAVTKQNEPFRDENDAIFFRPGGHGALIENLNSQTADLIFIKNIDNVVVPKYRDLVARNKKVLAGYLLKLQEKAFEYLGKLEQDEVSDEILDKIIQFLQKELNSGLSIDFSELPKAEKIAAIKRKLNRPIRVCGMVKNEGEPGGGPFWVKEESGEISLQIVENSQIDHQNYQQSSIAKEATHFNPVDIVCSTKDYKGAAFDLSDFVDQDTSFISNKTKDGKELKALEHPGLWNGGMSNWISIFIEVPVETFNPVKTVVDLLKSTHQVK